jgi:hypothetical protein
VTIDLRFGDWRHTLADVTCDALIADPPYGSTTHEGWNAGEKQVRSATGQSTRTAISYVHWTPDDVSEFVASWAPRCRGWMACMTSDDLIPAWKAAYAAAGRYPFAPVPIKQVRPRLLGDGPASWFVYLMVARPRNREYATWGCLRGGYDSFCEKKGVVAGAKPVELMREIVRDYSRPDELVCDPTCGGATTLLAARLEGRRAVGAEVNATNFEKALARCAVLPAETDYSKQRCLF